MKITSVYVSVELVSVSVAVMLSSRLESIDPVGSETEMSISVENDMDEKSDGSSVGKENEEEKSVGREKDEKSVDKENEERSDGKEKEWCE